MKKALRCKNAGFFAARWLWLPLLLMAMAVSGCTREVRHQVLTFFFTGVPPLEDPQSGRSSGELKSQQAVPQTVTKMATPGPTSSAAAGNPAPGANLPQTPRFYSHPVWLEGSCGACHAGERSFGFQVGGIAGRAPVTRIFNSGGGMPGELKHPKNRLCLECHTDKTGLRAIRDALWLHNTTAKGDCLACHDAHQGGYRGVLRRPPELLCQSCHPEDKLAAVPMHRSAGQSCRSCHNPHMGKDRHLLTRDYQEVKVPSRREP